MLKGVELKKADKRQRILAAGLNLFVERGFHGTAVPAIAADAGVGAGTIYRFFESKEVLVNEVFRDAKSRLGMALWQGLDLEQAPRVLFDAFWARLDAFARTEPQAFVFLELHNHASYLDESSRLLEQQVLLPVHGVMERLRRSGVFRADLPTSTAMALVWGAFVGVLKAERQGYLRGDDARSIHARDACWRACVSSEPRTKSGDDDVRTR